jgi:hypothetical protein
MNGRRQSLYSALLTNVRRTASAARDAYQHRTRAGAYTAIVRGSGGVGIAAVKVYQVV